MNISFNAGSSGGYSSINKNSAQYKAVERDRLSAIIANEATAYGVAGMCVDGKSPSEYNQIIDVSEDWRQEMFDMVKREFIQENGVANGDTTKRTSLYTSYQKKH